MGVEITMKNLNEYQLANMAAEALGTSMTEDRIMDLFSMTETNPDEVIETLGELGVERCAQCGYWTESESLLPGEGCKECKELR